MRIIVSAFCVIIFSTLAVSAVNDAPSAALKENNLLSGNYKWITGKAVIMPQNAYGEDWISVKDPSIVQFDGAWHIFFTARGKKRTHAIIYITFADGDKSLKAKHQVLKCHAGYFCAPQVFYFAPHKQWYLICQAADDSWNPKYQPAWSCTKDIANPDLWSKLNPLFEKKPAGINAWLDFWIICDEKKAYLFFTSLDGKMWRSETPLGKFPQGWTAPVIALQGDIFEAAHIYRVKGTGRFIALIEAQNGHGWRYYKAYVAERLDGEWKPLADEKDKAFASMRNVEQKPERWTDSISHGELLRTGFDEKLEVSAENPRFLFQGVLDKERNGKGYGDIPWRLGILEPATAANSEK